MNISDWGELMLCLWDSDGKMGHPLPGSDPAEWLCLVKYDYDEVDSFYLDHDIIGA